MSRTVDYDKDYFENYLHREGTEIAVRLNQARTSLTEKYCDCVLDMGIGSGEFIKSSNIKVLGFDINPAGIEWLQRRGLFIDPYIEVPEEVEGFSLWDTLEHIPNPQEFFRVVESGEYVFVSLPIFKDLENIRKSKHYKPYEHLYYYTQQGLIRFMKDSGFIFLEYNEDETAAGREGIGSFVFLKD
jgi:hypothetical protein